MTASKRVNEIITEVRAIRESLVAEYDYDVDRLFAALQEREKVTKREVRESSPKRVQAPESV